MIWRLERADTPEAAGLNWARLRSPRPVQCIRTAGTNTSSLAAGLLLRAGRILTVAAVLIVGSVHGAAAAKPMRLEWLRVGEVLPRGWLLEQIRMDATNGYGPVLGKLFDGCDINAFDCRAKKELPPNKLSSGEVWWNGETTGNWLDGLIRTAYLSGDEAAKRKVDDIVARVLAMQEEDGYLGTYPPRVRYEQPVASNNGELWSQACLFRGLLAYSEFTGRKDVFEVVQRAAKLMMSKYGPDKPYWSPDSVQPGGGPGHDLMFVDVCEWLYRATGDGSYLDFARFLYDGYSSLPKCREYDNQLSHLANLSELFSGHGAHVMEHLRVPLFLYYATGDEKYHAAADNVFPKTFRHLSAGGACIGDESIRKRLGNPNIGCEYCTMLELLNSLQSGVQKTGQAALADRIEVLTFNAAEGARLRDGRAIEYLTRDNQSEISRKAAGGRFKLSPTHDDVAVCCPVTALKFFPYFVQGLWMKTEGGKGLAAVAYAPSEVRTTINGVQVRIRSETVYPFEDEVRMTVAPEKPVACSITLRVPEWARKVSIKASGARQAEDAGWRILSKEWKAGDRIVIRFEPEVERMVMPQGEVYWRRGPLVYGLPIPGEGRATRTYPIAGFADYDYTPKEGAFWDYSVEAQGGSVRFIRTQPRGNPWETAPVRLKGNLVNGKTGRDEAVEMVPMGVTLLRRVTFPIVTRAALSTGGRAKKRFPMCSLHP